jgi:hypothetical protein
VAASRSTGSEKERPAASHQTSVSSKEQPSSPHLPGVGSKELMHQTSSDDTKEVSLLRRPPAPVSREQSENG